MVFTLNLFQIGFICFMTFLVTIIIIVILEPVLDLTNKKKDIVIILNIFWISSLMFLIYVLCLPTAIIPEFIKIKEESNILLSAIGIVLSAFMASISVMKNIQTTKELKEEEIKSNHIKDLNYSRFLLESTKEDLKFISSNLWYFEENIKENDNRKFSKGTYNYLLKLVDSLNDTKRNLTDKSILYCLNKNENLTILGNILESIGLISILINSKINNNEFEDVSMFIDNEIIKNIQKIISSIDEDLILIEKNTKNNKQ